MKTAILFFGRTQPCVHKGHEMIFDKMRNEWLKDPQNSSYFIYLTMTVNRNSPIPYKTKLDISKQLVPLHASRFVDEHPGNLISVLKDLQENYTDIKIYTGSDRSLGLSYVYDYNGKEYNFNSIEVVNAGERNIWSTGVDGISGTKLRECIRNKDLDGFIDGIPRTPKEKASEVFNTLSNEMNVVSKAS
ncbi:rossmann-like alpha/beta/alpha sandwich fold protein [Vibrio phage 2.275.O._10N.286.54.E11]|nr:rossmann-like alpha/beta/alpha sandwich fold protein [Vibrio phage 2.275.O._10N.286.54.E11]